MNFSEKFSQIARAFKIKTEVLELFFANKTSTTQAFKDCLTLFCEAWNNVPVKGNISINCFIT